MEHFQWGSLTLCSRGRGSSYLKGRFNVEGSLNFLAISGGLSKCTFGDIKSCFREGDCKFTFGWETKTFSKQLAKNNYRPGNSTLCRALRKKCPYSELFWSVFSCIRTEYDQIWSISPYSVWMWENMDQNNSEYEHFSLSGWLQNSPITDVLSNSTPTFSKDEGGEKIDCKGCRRDAEKGSDCSSSEQPKAVSVLNICCSKEVSRLSTHNKFKEIKILRRVQPLQIRENINTERTFE